MAAFALTYGYVNVASNDLSTHVKSVEFSVNGDVVDVTAMSSSAWRAMVAGLKSWSVAVTFNTDMAAAALDSILWSLYSTSVAVELRATGAAVSTSNPKYTGTAILQPGKIFGGQVGSASETTVTLVGTGAPTRATA